MVPRPLLFYDSGAGGLPYLALARTRLPGERFVYLADRDNYPFGEKEAEELRGVVLQTVGLAVERFAPKMVVLACNTASVVALEALRLRFPIPFVGVVPAVKPAARLRPGRIVVAATRQTVTGPYLSKLIEDFAGGLDVVRLPVSGLVDFAEYEYFSATPEQKLRRVRAELGSIAGPETAGVVLGCTHFLLLEEEFRAVLPPGTALIDSREGVVNRIAALLREVPAVRREGAAAGGELYLHGGAAEEGRYRLFAGRFGLSYGGRLETGSS
jgi:glutamate racemase